MPEARFSSADARGRSAHAVQDLDNVMHEQAYDYDIIADNIFAPIYPDIAKAIVERTGIRSGRLLDVGCGPGHMGFAVMDLGNFTADFCDINPQAVEIARRRVTERRYEGKVTVHTADVHTLPFPDKSFDLIVSRGSMPFWDNQRKAFTELYRVLKPDGLAYIGGGLGGRAHIERIAKLAKENACGFRARSGSNSKSLSDEEYIALFDQLGCSYQIIQNPDEGRWLMFGKRKHT